MAGDRTGSVFEIEERKAQGKRQEKNPGDVNNVLRSDLTTDFLDIDTQKWYADCGIPYRRGYLI